MNRHPSTIVVVACALLTTVLGSVHAFSVFVPQWENALGASRAAISFIYSLTLLSLTFAVLTGYRLYARVSPVSIFLMAGVGAGLGLYLAAQSQSLTLLYLSYGVIFGAANGLGYGFALQLAGQAVVVRRGLAMSVVTAFYAVGATLSPLLFVPLIERGGNALALTVMSVIVIVVALIAALLIYAVSARYHSDSASQRQRLSAVLARARWRLWCAYGCAVLSGLMAIGHAYNIAVWMQFSPRWALAAPVCVAVGNMLGGFCAGALADRLSSRLIVCWLPLLSALGLALICLPLPPSAVVGLLALTVIGFSYGALIAVYPVAITQLYGTGAAARVYGQVFTAWGLAGLLGPWLTGWLFDLQASYLSSLLIAMVLGLVAAGIIRYGMPTALQWTD